MRFDEKISIKQTIREEIEQLELTVGILRKKVEDYYKKRNKENRIDVVRFASEAMSSLLDILEDVQ